MIYDLVDTKMRDSLDLTFAQDVILEAIVCTYPEATDVMVFASFYCFKPPVFSSEERNRRVRCLGRVLAREVPALTRLAMRSYNSGNHEKSNQLFKAMKGKKRLSFCLELLEKAQAFK